MVNLFDTTYATLLQDVLAQGSFRQDRTGTGTYSIFGYQCRYDLTKGFPLLTTKKINFDSIWTELQWFLSGGTNIQFLKQNNVPIWNAWANDKGDLGPVYGAQWRKWEHNTISTTQGIFGPETTFRVKVIDQIQDLLDNLQTNPFSRRHVVTAWNPSVLPDENKSHTQNVAAGNQALPPCHTLFQFYVTELDAKTKAKTDKQYGLSCQLYQRSGDAFLGVPYNIASYALLTSIIAKMVNMVPLDFVHTFGDLHIYSNHLEQVQEQLQRVPNAPPQLKLSDELGTSRLGMKGNDIDNLFAEDVTLVNYNPHPFIKAPIAV